ncbi:hypothetical protein [Aliagarivorans marinus]|uniref:hypothetical protein n=1 Tax=Aliagarivorans marinus TaxID=561965 RepID=UPI0004051383|nr:hypothetical protein [Aliagarivorans marinus]
MGRPRSRQTRALPEHLYHDVKKGFRFTLVNGRRVSLGHSRQEAIAIALEYNHRMRGSSRYGLEDLVALSGSEKLRSFGDYVPELLAKILAREEPKSSKRSTLESDAKRAVTFFDNVAPLDIELTHVNDYLSEFHKGASANVYNRKIAWLEKLFGYACDAGIMRDNPASQKMKFPKKAPKMRRRLTEEDFLAIYDSAEPWLQVAMDLSLQTGTARLETVRISYNLERPQKGVCGCMWYKRPQNGVYGKLFIHRQKTENNEASWVAIPLGGRLKAIIDRSVDDVDSPYVVHRPTGTSSNKVSQNVEHPTQVNPEYLSKAFSAVRDELGLYAELPARERPSFHEIRALSAKLHEQTGVSPQKLLTHQKRSTTEIYIRGHGGWTEVEHMEVEVTLDSLCETENEQFIPYSHCKKNHT